MVSTESTHRKRLEDNIASHRRYLDGIGKKIINNPDDLELCHEFTITAHNLGYLKEQLKEFDKTRK